MNMSYIMALLFVSGALCDTEVVNFRVDGYQNRPKYNISMSYLMLGERRRLEMTPTSLEEVKGCLIWIPLWLDTSHGSYTLKLSWPASHPARFGINIIPPFMGVPTESSTLYHARVEAHSLGVLKPTFHLFTSTTQSPHAPSEIVPIYLVLDRNHLGVLPHTVIPIILAILITALLAISQVKQILKRLEGLAASAKEEFRHSAKSRA